MPQQFRSAREAVSAGLKAGAALESQPYDGICGRLPAWVPAFFVERFEEVRYKLLVTASYPLSKVQQYVQTYPERVMKPVMIGVTPIPGAILCDISWLCLLKDAVGAGPKQGMKMLLGETSAKEIIRGRNNINALSQRGKRRPALLPHSNKTIKNVVEELAFNHPGESANVLWRRFLGVLDELGLKPAVLNDPKNPRKSFYEYDNGIMLREITFGTFANIVSKYRVKK